MCFMLGQSSVGDKFVSKSLDSVVSDISEFCGEKSFKEARKSVKTLLYRVDDI